MVNQQMLLLTHDDNNWDTISLEYSLSEEFMRVHKNQLNWLIISFYQKLSENFIREFQNKLIWWYILRNKNINLSEDFITEMKLKGY